MINDLEQSELQSTTSQESLEEEFDQEKIIALAKHHENHSAALNETVVINKDIATINMQIETIRKRILCNKKKLIAIK